MDADSVADELYGLLPEEFIAARTAREKEAKAAGDKALAAQIHALGKPNQVGWLANQLARDHGDEIGPLLELGAELRDAEGTLTGDQLRSFSKQRNQLVHGLVQKARKLAHAAGKKVSEDALRGLQDTLQAALADPDAADKLVTGRLTQGLQHVGFGPAVGAPGGAASATSTSPAKGTAGRSRGSDKEPASDEIERAARKLEELKSRADEVTATRDEIHGDLDTARKRLADRDAEVSRLEEELNKALDDQSHARREEHRLRASLDRAEKAANDAVRRVEEAVKRNKALLDRQT